MRKALPFILLGGALLLLCIGIAALAYNYLGPRTAAVDTSKWIVPQDQVDTKKINSGVALGILAGTSDTGSVDDSLAAGDFEGAFAQMAYSTDFSDANRVGTLLLLGNRYASGKQTAKAVWMYKYAVFLSIVSPAPSDLNRVQALLEAAMGLRALNMNTDARAALDQAYLITQYSFALPRDLRADMFQQIARAYQAAGVSNLATEARQKGMDTYVLTKEDAINDTRKPFRIKPTGPTTDPDLDAKQKERETAAKELLDALNLNPPKSPSDLPDDLIRTLGDKLYEEDGLRTDYYNSQYDQAPDASAQLGILRDKLRWLALKYRVAKLGFGISIVPEWESDVKSIVQDLNDTYGKYIAITQQQATGLENKQESDRSSEDVLRAAIVAGRWGLYPQYDENDLLSQLSTVSQALRDEQVPALRLDTYANGNQTVFIMVPDELYGTGARALPK